MKKILLPLISLALLSPALTIAQQRTENPGIDNHMSNLYMLSNAQSRSISPENFTGEKGKGGMATEGTGKNAAKDLGQGWKVSPSVEIKSKSTFTLAEITGPGAIQHIWMTPTGKWRYSIIRFYWDDETEPSIEAPVGDFFCMGWQQYAQLSSLAVAVNPGSGFNCYWTMPFRKKCRITMENIDDRPMILYYQIDYTLAEIPASAAYLHAQFRCANPLPKKEVYTLVDSIRGKGQFVGTYLAWGVHSTGWWGEGEMKFFIDGDKTFPTLNFTGLEDYFCGSYNFENQKTHQYQEFSNPYTGLHQVVKPDGMYNSQQRFGMYRWHIKDPVRFNSDLRVTIQALGWQDGGRYLPLQDDIFSTVFWYQTEPHVRFPALPVRDMLGIN